MTADRLATRIMWGLAAGVVIGIALRLLSNANAIFSDVTRTLAVHVLEPFGQVFLRLLFIVVVPLVFASLALGVVQLGRLERLGPLAARTFSIFALNMLIGVGLALLAMNLVRPGWGLDEAVRQQLLTEFGSRARDMEGVAASRAEFTSMLVVETFMPRNLLKAVVEFQMLPLILFALLVGAAGTALGENERARLAAGLDVIAQLMTRIVGFALRLAPYAVPAMIISVVVRFGTGILGALLAFVVTMLVAMAIHLFGTMSLLLRVMTNRSPRVFFRAVKTVLVTAFSTSSSSATLPTSIAVSRADLGVSPSTASFVLPLGATMNMSGTAMYEGAVVLFVAQVYGVELPLAQQVVLLLLAVLSAVAVAGIPGGSLPLIVGLLATFGVPAEGIALILGVDRILDMARTTLNVAADLVTTVIVDDAARPG